MNTEVLFSSKSDEWETPNEFFVKISLELGPFDLDVCATPKNTKCFRFYTEKDDGLTQPWDATKVWMNPPYSEIKLWMKKAYEESQKGALVVCLVPSRTDTRWFHDYAMKGEVRFIRGRLKFGGSKNSAPFPSALVIFRPQSLDNTQYCAGCEVLARQVEDLKAQLAAANDTGPCGCEIYETCEHCRS